MVLGLKTNPPFPTSTLTMAPKAAAANSELAKIEMSCMFRRWELTKVSSDGCF